MPLIRRSLGLVLICLALPAMADEPPTWGLTTFDHPFVTDGTFVVGSEMSGIASIDGAGCVVVSNETRCAQIGYITRNPWRLTAGREISLVPPKGTDECDFEAVAADPKGLNFYVLGSHSVSKNKGKPRFEQQALFRIPADPATNVPDYKKPGANHCISLFPWLERVPELRDSLNKPLQQNGLNFEGLAFRDGKLWIGCRAPSLQGHTPILEVAADPLFDEPAASWPQPKVHMLPLGEGIGVRDMTPVRDGILLLVGQSGSEPSRDFPKTVNYDGDKAFPLLLWRMDGSNTLERIGNLPLLKGKAEGLLVLRETATDITILVLYDGAFNGAPRMFTLTKPRR